MAFATPIAFQTLISGMETSLTFLMLALVLWLAFGERAGRWPWWVLPISVVAVYLTRPDALLLALAVLVVGHVQARAREQDGKAKRLWPVRELVLTGLLLASVLLACRIYFGSALPLPFYAKQAAFSPYDPHFRELARESGFERFGTFLFFATPAFLLAAAKRDFTNLGLLAAVIAHAAYHRLFTIDVMGMHGRFYVPELPVLAFAGARGVAALSDPSQQRSKFARLAALVFVAVLGLFFCIELLPQDGTFKPERLSWTAIAVTCAILAIALALAARPTLRQCAALALLIAAAVLELPALQRAHVGFLSDDEHLRLHAARGTVFRGLDTLRSCFGDGIDVYHSEVGVPGLRFLHGKVTDLAGLMSPVWLFRDKGSFDRLCAADQPEAIFLPHKVYAELNREILAGTCIAGFRRVVEESASALFVRQDLSERYVACAKARQDLPSGVVAVDSATVAVDSATVERAPELQLARRADRAEPFQMVLGDCVVDRSLIHQLVGGVAARPKRARPQVGGAS